MVEICDKKKCCGCKACGDACPKKAISYKVDEEGFWYPVVDRALCINCGLCDKACPMGKKDSLLSHGQKDPKIFGGYHKNILVRFDSTSGGAFTALANEMYARKGYVSGAVFNEDWSVSNFISNDKKDLPRIRSSKYVQSSAEGLYSRIKELLISGEKVLACGSPCQMAALRTYLGKDYENLIIVDFLCRANNSPKAYRKYLDWLESKYGSKIVAIKAKNKDHGWRSLSRKVTFENGKVYYGDLMEDHYRRAYHSNKIVRPSCFACEFKGMPRVADITISDFWGVERIAPHLDGDLGTSLIFCNTDKGLAFFDSAKKNLVFEEIDFEKVIDFNKTAILSPCPYPTDPNFDRVKMFSDMASLPFDKVAELHFPLQTNSAPVKISLARRLVRLARATIALSKRFAKSPVLMTRTFLLNDFRKNTSGGILEGRYINVHGQCALDIDPTARIECNNGVLQFGLKRNRKSKRETQLLMESNSVLRIDGSNYIKPDSDIQIFKNAKLRIGSGGTNLGLKIVCAKDIWIGDHVHIGRDVWIRDNNGGHKIIQFGYTDQAPVKICDNVWLCSNVSVMKGVTIGEGTVIAGNSVVTHSIPAHCIASGNPAQVIAKDIVWRP